MIEEKSAISDVEYFRGYQDGCHDGYLMGLKDAAEHLKKTMSTTVVSNTKQLKECEVEE
jgi:hypothetical protein